MTANTVRKIVRRLEKIYPAIRTSLKHGNAFELLVATILSAQCTDERVNFVTKRLFKKYKTPEDFVSVGLRALENIIRPTGYYHSKARHIKLSSKMIVEKFGSRVPDTMEELLELPGVGRKTANIILSVAYGKDAGIAVDTHVRRLSKRLGLTKNDNPDKIEKDLIMITPNELRARVTMLLILHGRNVCYARNPDCVRCVLNDICPSAFSFGRE
ncbi:MAG: endonuclease III [Thaumarchaeota archaeon]|nr:endonuclease III [Nitrososphaerota archaeon]